MYLGTDYDPVRLTREVTTRVQTAAYLTQEYEVAKLAAQEDIPVVRVMGEPSLPTLRSGAFRSIVMITTFLVSTASVILAIYVVDLVNQALKRSDMGDLARVTEDLSRAFPISSRLYHQIRHKEERDKILMDSWSGIVVL